MHIYYCNVTLLVCLLTVHSPLSTLHSSLFTLCSVSVSAVAYAYILMQCDSPCLFTNSSLCICGDMRIYTSTAIRISYLLTLTLTPVYSNPNPSLCLSLWWRMHILMQYESLVCLLNLHFSLFTRYSLHSLLSSLFTLHSSFFTLSLSLWWCMRIYTNAMRLSLSMT
jgi:hypothetical protein